MDTKVAVVVLPLLLMSQALRPRRLHPESLVRLLECPPIEHYTLWSFMPEFLNHAVVTLLAHMLVFGARFHAMILYTNALTISAA